MTIRATILAVTALACFWAHAAKAQISVPGATCYATEIVNNPNCAVKTNETGFVGIFRAAPFGQFNDAAAFSIGSNQTNALAQVNGFTTIPQLGNVNNGSWSTLTLYVANTARPILATASAANYSATQLLPVTNLSANVVAQLQKELATCTSTVPICSVISTNHSPPYMGAITAVAADGSSLTVSGWFQSGNNSTGQIPSNGVDAYIDPDSHSYTANFTSNLRYDSFSNFTTGLEIDVLNSKATYIGNGNVGNSLGLTTNCHGPYVCSQAYIALGAAGSPFYQGYLSQGNTYGFSSQGDSTAGYQILHSTTDPFFGYVTYQSTGYPYSFYPGGAPGLANIAVTMTAGSASISTTSLFTAGQKIFFSSTVGTAGGQVVVGTTYYVLADGLTSSTFEVSATSGGTAIIFNENGNSTSTSTGTGIPSWLVDNFGAMTIGNTNTYEGITISGTQGSSIPTIAVQGPNSSALRLLPKSTRGIILGNTQITPDNNATCTVNEFVEDGNYIYVCTATNTYKRAALSAY